eukprot:4396422-Pyramimonas_sp.AAC.1
MAPSWLPHDSLMTPSWLPHGSLTASSWIPHASIVALLCIMLLTSRVLRSSCFDITLSTYNSQAVMLLRPRPHVEQLSPAQVIHKIVAPIIYKGILKRDAPCHPTGSRRRHVVLMRQHVMKPLPIFPPRRSVMLDRLKLFHRTRLSGLRFALATAMPLLARGRRV